MRRVSSLAVVAALIAVVLAAPSGAFAASYDATIGITFPVAGQSSYADWYDAGRSGGRAHKATDIMAGAGQVVHAAQAGTISWITGLDGSPPSYGYMITVAGVDGRSYGYVHLGRQDKGPRRAYVSGLRKGTRVERGQPLGYVGCSGNASCSAPHLHFGIEDPSVTDPYGSSQMNPYTSLKAAQRRGDVPGTGRFWDVRPDMSHFPNVEHIADAKITVGCGDKTAFCPSDRVTRAEMATFLRRALGLAPVEKDRFTDVAASSSHRVSINAIAEAGITVGCGDKTTYCPDDSVTRAEMATFLRRAFELAPVSGNRFSDVAASSSHRESINAIAEAGITVGCGDKTTYCPQRDVTRAEMATFLARALKA